MNQVSMRACEASASIVAARHVRGQGEDDLDVAMLVRILVVLGRGSELLQQGLEAPGQLGSLLGDESQMRNE